LILPQTKVCDRFTVLLDRLEKIAGDWAGDGPGAEQETVEHQQSAEQLGLLLQRALRSNTSSSTNVN